MLPTIRDLATKHRIYLIALIQSKTQLHVHNANDKLLINSEEIKPQRTSEGKADIQLVWGYRGGGCERSVELV